jgi:RNA recognition motif-containing protein
MQRVLFSISYRLSQTELTLWTHASWAFVDFHTIAQATSALLNPHNHSLNGRKLVVEYASADAVRRGGGGAKQGSTKKRPRPEDEVLEKEPPVLRDLNAPEEKKHKPNQAERRAARAAAKSRTETSGKKLAKRSTERVGIVESAGKRITFD